MLPIDTIVYPHGIQQRLGRIVAHTTITLHGNPGVPAYVIRWHDGRETAEFTGAVLPMDPFIDQERDRVLRHLERRNRVAAKLGVAPREL